MVNKKLIELKNNFIAEFRALSVVVGIAGGLILVGVIISLIIGELQTSTTSMGYGNTTVVYNVSNLGLQFYQSLFKQTPLLGTLLVFLVLASIALGIFSFFGGGKRQF